MELSYLKVTTMLYIFLFLSLSNSWALPFIWSEFYHVMFANLSNFDHMMLPGLTDDEDIAEPIPVNKTLRSLGELLQDANQIGDIDKIAKMFVKKVGNGQGQDEKKFNELNLEMFNLTRRIRDSIVVSGRRSRYGRWYGFYDYKDPYPRHVWESRKIAMVKSYGLQFLTHSRYKIAQALVQCAPLREDKRYQLGFLFSRLRRILTEMLKFTATAGEQYWLWWSRRTQLNLRMYQQVVMLDQDIKDTIEYIKEIYARNVTYDYEHVSRFALKRKPFEPRTN